MPAFEFDPELDTAVTVCPASPEAQTELGNLVNAISGYPEFRTPRSLRHTHEAVYRVEETSVRLGIQPNGTAEIFVKEVPDGESLERSDFFTHSTYKFRRLVFGNGYKHMPSADEFRYWHKSDGKKILVPPTVYDDPEVGPLRFIGALRREHEVEKIWQVGKLTARRCAQLIHLAGEFNPVTARPVRKVR
jgi:hypothetical protein